MRGDREPSTVMVRVLDMTSVAQEGLEWKRKHQAVDGDAPMAGCHVSPKWGIVVTRDGVYALCSEGVGPADPITEDNPVMVDMFEDARPSADKPGTTMFSIFPFAQVPLDHDDLMRLPVLEEVPLHDFIRTFGARLEANYSSWRRRLEGVTA